MSFAKVYELGKKRIDGPIAAEDKNVSTPSSKYSFAVRVSPLVVRSYVTDDPISANISGTASCGIDTPIPLA